MLTLDNPLTPTRSSVLRETLVSRSGDSPQIGTRPSAQADNVARTAARALAATRSSCRAIWGQVTPRAVHYCSFTCRSPYRLIKQRAACGTRELALARPFFTSASAHELKEAVSAEK